MRRITVSFPRSGEDERRKRQKRGAAAALLIVAALLGAAWASAPPPKPIVITQTVTQTETVPVVQTNPPATATTAPPVLAPGKVVATPPRLLFGPTPAPQIVRVSNGGDLPLVLGAPSIRGKSFRLSSDCPAELAKNETCGVAVVFDASVAGSARDTLTIGSAQISLAGTAPPPPRPPVEIRPPDLGHHDVPVPPEIVQPSTLPPIRLDIEPKQLDFGRVVPRTKTIVVSNPGPRAVRVSDVTLEPLGVFKVESQCRGVVLQPNQRCTVSVSVPPFHGAAAGRIIVHYDGGSESAGVSATNNRQ